MNNRLHFESITSDKLLPYIKAAFSGDQPLLSKFHVSPGTLDHCAEHTFNNIMFEGGIFLQYFKVEMKIEGPEECEYVPIGFVVITNTFVNVLVSFGLNIAFRSSVLKQEWLEKISAMFTPKEDGISFVVSLHDRNIRAINYFKRNGFNYKPDSANKIVSLWR